ncbi:MAG: hypothetical protein J5802_11640 [Butyrivibrio sp.]|nr:hypothetical protein [Butyrivibrio sp.]
MKRKLLIVMLSMTIALVSVGCEGMVLPNDPIMNLYTDKDNKEAEEIEKLTSNEDTEEEDSEKDSEKEDEEKDSKKKDKEETTEKEDSKEDKDEEKDDKDSSNKIDDAKVKELAKGKIDGQTYENEYFNFKLTLGKSYEVSSEAELAEDNDPDDDSVLSVFYAMNNNTFTSIHMTLLKLNANTDEDPNEHLVIMGLMPHAGESLEEEGFTDVKKELDTVTYLGDEHPSISISAKYKTMTYYQKTTCITEPGYVMIINSATLDDKTAIDNLLSKMEELN